MSSPDSQQTFYVSGLNCHRCAETVVEQLRTLEGVSAVDITEHLGGDSQVRLTSESPVPGDALQAALSRGGAFTIVARPETVDLSGDVGAHASV